MRNYVQPGDVVTLSAPYAVSSGDGLLVGALFGVASADAANGAAVEAAVRGVFDLTGTGGAAGSLVYWDDTAKEVTATSTDNTLIGHALTGAGAGRLRVRLSA